jgi:hypothetical protein
LNIIHGAIIAIFAYPVIMQNNPQALAGWTAEEIADGKRWVQTWRRAGAELERIRRKELREQDNYQVIQLLLGDFDYTQPPRAPKPWSGLVELQRLFMKARHRE